MEPNQCVVPGCEEDEQVVLIGAHPKTGEPRYLRQKVCGKHLGEKRKESHRRRQKVQGRYQAGARWRDSQGRWWTRLEDGGPRVLLARHLIEQKLGRELGRTEGAYFLDGDKDNLSPENLVIGLQGSYPAECPNCGCTMRPPFV